MNEETRVEMNARYEKAQGWARPRNLLYAIERTMPFLSLGVIVGWYLPFNPDDRPVPVLALLILAIMGCVGSVAGSVVDAYIRKILSTPTK